MSEIRIWQERVVGAAPDIVYECLADYREHHPKILPSSFLDFHVESGGHGAGTVMTFKTKAAGMVRSWRGSASEPEPGRVLVETYDNGTVTTFFVDPAEGGSRVRIETVWTPKGIQGLVERLLAARLMRPVYEQELENLDRYARSLPDEKTGTVLS